MKWNRVVKWTGLALPALLVVALGVGCDDDEGNGITGPTIADVQGTWVASPGQPGTSLVLTPNAAPGNAVDAVNTLGGTFTLTITSNGDFELVISIPALQIAETITGEITITETNRATLVNDADPTDVLTATFSLTNNDNTLSITVQDAELINLIDPPTVGPEDAAELDATFVRT